MATNEPKLKQVLDNKQSYLIAPLSATGNQVNLIAIAHLKYKRWSVLFAQPLPVAVTMVSAIVTQVRLSALNGRKNKGLGE